MESKICNACGEEKPLDAFQERIVKGVRYPRTRCSACENRLRAERRSPEAIARQWAARQKRLSHQRANDINRASWVLKDCNRTDSRKGLFNDLEITYIEMMLSYPCAYCGRGWEEARMTLDRIDNSQGHLQSNVQTACEPCNLNRGDCDYQEWMSFVQQMGPHGMAELARKRKKRRRLV